jgi:transposase-like protein
MEKKICPTCGAEYEVRMVHAMMRDKDSYECSVCDTELDRWNGSTFPSYRLVKRPDKWPKE